MEDDETPPSGEDGTPAEDPPAFNWDSCAFCGEPLDGWECPRCGAV